MTECAWLGGCGSVEFIGLSEHEGEESERGHNEGGSGDGDGRAALHALAAQAVAVIGGGGVGHTGAIGGAKVLASVLSLAARDLRKL